MDLKTISGRFFNTNVLLLGANFMLLLCFFCQLERIDIGNYFNSDSLYLPSIYRDLFVDKNGLESWHFNGAPNVFPDMLVYFALMFFSMNNFIVASFIFSFLQYFVILYLFVKIFKAVAPGQSPKLHSVIYLVQSLWLLEFFYFTGNFIFMYFLVCNSYHTGSFVMTLCCFLIVLDFFKEPAKLKLIWLFLLVFASAFSDKLFIVSFIAPLCLTSLFFLRGNLKKIFLLVAVSGLATFLSKLLYDAINETHYVSFLQPNLEMSAERTGAAYKLFFGLMREYTLNFGYHSISMFLFLFSVICLVLLMIWKRRSLHLLLRFFLVFIVVQSVIVLFAPVVIGNFTGYDTLRYNIYPLYMSGLNMAVIISIFARYLSPVKVGARYLIFAAALALFVTGFINFSREGLKNYFTYYPETARRLDEVAEKEGLINGVGNFWYAKSTTMFSKKGIRVVAVYDDLYSFLPVTNESWYYNQNNKFNFVILNNFVDTTLYSKKVLKTEMLYNEPKFKLVKTNIFTFDKNTGGAKNN